MKNVAKLIVIAFISVLTASGAFAQEWTKAQTEVWQRVETEWSAWKSGDIAGMTAILHDKYQGWNTEYPLPVTKSMTNTFMTEMKNSYKVNNYLLNPARISVADNSAVVDYFYSYSVSFGEGENSQTKEFKGRVAEFYTKEGGKWLLLGDLMVEDKQDDHEE